MTAHYTAMAKGLHWLMAILLFALLALGFYMQDLPLSPEKLRLYSWHKWAGTHGTSRRITMNKLTRLGAALVLAVAAATPALAAPETYTVDGSHSFACFSYNHFGYSTQLSRFDRTSGKIIFDKAARTGSVDIVIDAKPVAVEGSLTLKGVTRQVTLTLTSFQAMPHPMMKKDAVGANANVTVKRSEFNAGRFVPYVGDDVRIDIAVEAIRG